MCVCVFCVLPNPNPNAPSTHTQSLKTTHRWQTCTRKHWRWQATGVHPPVGLLVCTAPIFAPHQRASSSACIHHRRDIDEKQGRSAHPRTVNSRVDMLPKWLNRGGVSSDYPGAWGPDMWSQLSEIQLILLVNPLTICVHMLFVNFLNLEHGSNK